MPRFSSSFRFSSSIRFGSFDGVVANRYLPKVADGLTSSQSYYLVNGRLAKIAIPGDPVYENFGQYVRGNSSMATEALRQAIERQILSWEIRGYIQDNNGNLCDISDRAEFRGRNQLRKIGTLEYVAERLRGALQQKMSSVTLDNSDGFWDQKISGSTFRATYDQNWNLLGEGVCDSVWDTSTGGKETALYHHKFFLRAHFQIRGSDAVEILTLGVFLIEDITTSSDSAYAEIKLAPMSSPLINNTAEVVKAGAGWYQNRSPKFLIEQILKKEYSTSTGLLPTTYDIENIFEIDIPYAEVGTKKWGSSAYGRPPENTTNYAGASTTWTTGEVRICRAMCLWEYGKGTGTAVGTPGTVTLTPGSDTIVGSGTQWALSISLGAESSSWSGVCWSPELGLLVAVGSGSGKYVMTSTNGVSWTTRDAAENNNWRSVCWSSSLSLFVAVASNGTNRVMKSSDGITWTSSVSTENSSWTSVTWSAALSKFVAVADTGTNRVYYSSDGITWATSAAAAANQWQGVCWSPELAIFVAVSNNGTNRVMTSANGLDWTIQTATEASTWKSIAWSPGLTKFAAVADSGTNRIMYSSNGTSWSAVPGPAANNWQGVCWSTAEGRFIAVGSSGSSNRVMTSSNGISWNTRTSAADSAWSSVVYAPEIDLTVAVASSSSNLLPVMTSTETTVWSLIGAQKQAPRIGDAFVIPKEFISGDGGSQQGAEGKYTIVSITDDTHLVLDRPVNGDAVETGRKYSIPRLYLGIGSELYEYNVATDIYRQLTQNSSTIGATYAIRRIWHNPNDATYPIWGVALTDLGEQDDTITHSMLVFRFYWNSTTPVVDLFGNTAIAGVFLGDQICREGDYTLNTFSHFGIGNIAYESPPANMITQNAPITIPYSQSVANSRNSGTNLTYGFSNPSFSGYARTYTGSLIWTDSPNYVSGKTGKNSIFFDRGLYSLAGNNVYPPWSARYSMGQEGFMILNSNFSTNGAIVFTKTTFPSADANTASDTNPEYAFTYHYIDLSQSDPGASAPTVTSMTGASFTIEGIDYLTGYLPVCGCSDPDTDDVYVGLIHFKVGVVETNAAILKITSMSATTAITRLFYESTSSNPFIYSMVCSSQKLFMAGIDLPNMMGTTPYYLWVHSKTAADQILVTKHSGAAMYQGLQVIDIDEAPPGGQGSATTRLFYQQTGTKSTIAYVFDNATQQTDSDTYPPTVVAILPATDGDPFMMNGAIVSSSNTMEMYWISSTAPTFNIANRAEGKFYLCKWSNTAAVRIELAEFSGMSQWEAIEQIREVVDARTGFKPDGNFFFKKPPKHNLSQYTFTNVGQNRIASIVKQRGLEYIVNSATRTPHRPRLDDIKIGLRLIPNSKFGVVPDGSDGSTEKFQTNFDCIQRDIEAKAIRLVCVAGGRTAVAGATEVATREAAFKWTINKATASTQITEVYTANDPSITLESSEDVVYGTSVDLKGTASASSTTEVTGSTKVGLKILYGATPVQLVINGNIDEFQSTIPVHLLGGGAASLTSGNIYGLSRNIIPGDILLVGNTSSGTTFEYMQVVWLEAQVMHVVRGIGGTLGGSALAHTDGEYVVLIRNAYTVFLDAASYIDQAFIIGSEAILAHPDSSNWSDRHLIDPNDTSTAAAADQYWYPVNHAFQPIGGKGNAHDTGLSLKLDYDGSRGDEPPFSVGDIIVLETRGLILSADTASIKSYSDMSSQKIWKKRSDDSDNRFYSDRLAQWAAIRAVTENSNPRYVFEVSGILAPWLSLLDVVDLELPEMLMGETQRKVSCYILGISMDVGSKGGATYSLRSISSY